MLGEWLGGIASAYGIEPGLAKLRENTAQPGGRFEGFTWQNAGERLRAKVRASRDYQVYSYAVENSRVVEETFAERAVTI
jgi:hypothetical protein